MKWFPDTQPLTQVTFHSLKHSIHPQRNPLLTLLLTHTHSHSLAHTPSHSLARTQLVITVASDAVEKPPPVVNPTSSSSTTTGLNGAEAEFEGDLCAVESDILGMVSSLQIFIADNALVTAFLNKPKTRQSFVAALKPAGGGGAGDYGTTRALNKVTAFSLTSYIDPTKVQALTSIPTPS